MPILNIPGLIAAAETTSGAAEDIDTFLLIVGLLGGLAIFLLGMERMTESLRLIAGDRMRTVLLQLTGRPLVGLLTGAGLTALIQSSSVTTVLVVGFITSGLMTFQQSIGVIIGANIGTTVTAQIIAFNVSTVALVAVAVGFGISFFARSEKRRTQGLVVLGLGLVFYGMTVMGDAMSPLRGSDAFLDIMARLENPFFGILVGAAFTAVVQSSSATTGIVIVLAQQGLINIETGLALVLGANVGTAITAILAALGKPRDAMRAASAHVLFNVGGVVLWLPLLAVLVNVVSSIGGGTAREIANAHAIFNIANAVIFLPFTTRIAKLVYRIVPNRPGDEDELIRLKYLDETLLRTPILALDRARLEILRMASRVETMLIEVLPALVRGTRWTLLEIEQGDAEVDSLHAQIIDFLGKIGMNRLNDAAADELFSMIATTNNLEAIGDVIETNLVGLGLGRVEQNLAVTDEAIEVLSEVHSAVLEALQLSIAALTDKDPDSARRAIKMKKQINSLERSAAARQAGRLSTEAPERVATYRLETDVIANLRRIYYYTRRIARVAVPKGEYVELSDRED